MFLAALILLIGGGAAGFLAGRKFERLQPRPFGPDDMANLLEEAAHKFLVHANEKHVGDGESYEGDLRYARSFLQEAQEIRREEEKAAQMLLEE